MGLGSVISQTLIEDRAVMDLDWRRILRFAAFGYVFSVSSETSCACLILTLVPGPIRSILVLRVREALLQHETETD